MNVTSRIGRRKSDKVIFGLAILGVLALFAYMGACDSNNDVTEPTQTVTTESQVPANAGQIQTTPTMVEPTIEKVPNLSAFVDKMDEACYVTNKTGKTRNIRFRVYQVNDLSNPSDVSTQTLLWDRTTPVPDKSKDFRIDHGLKLCKHLYQFDCGGTGENGGLLAYAFKWGSDPCPTPTPTPTPSPSPTPTPPPCIEKGPIEIPSQPVWGESILEGACNPEVLPLPVGVVMSCEKQCHVIGTQLIVIDYTCKDDSSRTLALCRNVDCPPPPQPTHCYYEVTGQSKQWKCENKGGDWENWDNAFHNNHCRLIYPGVSDKSFNLTPGQSETGCLRKQDD